MFPLHLSLLSRVFSGEGLTPHHTLWSGYHSGVHPFMNMNVCEWVQRMWLIGVWVFKEDLSACAGLGWKEVVTTGREMCAFDFSYLQVCLSEPQGPRADAAQI